MHDRAPKPSLASLSATVLLSLLLPSNANAQDAVQVRSAQIAAAARLHPGQKVRLALPDVGRVAGTMELDSSGHLIFQPANGPTPVGIGGADTLWLRKRAWLPGMIVGGVIGAGFAALVLVAAEGLCESDNCVTPGVGISFSVLSTAAGAALGAGVGALIPKWKRTWVGSP